MERWAYYSQAQRGEEKASEAEQSRLQGEYSNLRGEHAALKSEHAALKSEHANLKGEHANLKGEHTNLKGEHSKLKKEHGQLQSRCKALTEASEGLKLSCQSAESRVSLAKQLAGERVQEISAKTKALQERCVSLGALAEQHRVAHAKEELQHRTLQARHAELLGAHVELQGTSRSLEAQKHDLLAQHQAFMERHRGLVAQQESLASDLDVLAAGQTERTHQAERAQHLERQLLEANQELKAARGRESKAISDMHTLRAIHKAQQAEDCLKVQSKLQASPQPKLQPNSNIKVGAAEAKASDSSSLAWELQKASDALTLIKDCGDALSVRARIREANALLLGMQWRLLNCVDK